MFASLLILAVSSVLFVYWFRYTCLLILAARRTKDYSKQVATANQLTFPTVRDRLATPDLQPALVSDVFRGLDRDYELLTYLLGHVAQYAPAGFSAQQWLLKLDYIAMMWWYRIVHRVSAALAKEALLEMASVVQHLANAVGERVAVSTKS